MPYPSLRVKGLLNGYQRIFITAGKTVKITSSNIYTPLGINAHGVASGIRASYFVLYTEFNNDGGQAPFVYKMGRSWANPGTFYFKVESGKNILAVKAHSNGSLILDINGSISSDLVVEELSDLSEYTELTPITFQIG